MPGPGGSRKGRPNKRSAGLLAEIKRQFPNYDPIMHMAGVAADEDNPQEMRLDASKTIAQYVYPKLKAIEITGEDGGALRHIISADPMTLAQWEEAHSSDATDS